VGFTGTKSCAASGCHEQICQDFQSVPMGDSMTPANIPAELARVPHTLTIYSKKLDRYLQVTRQGSDLYQSEYQLDEKGKKVFTATQKLDYRYGASRGGRPDPRKGCCDLAFCGGHSEIAGVLLSDLEADSTGSRSSEALRAVVSRRHLYAGSFGKT
jgi:hypothetical protein